MNTNATNSTSNYNLPLFVATDKPAWLVDWNNTMEELDSLIKSVADSTDTTEIVADISALQTSLSSLTTTVNTLVDEVEDPTTGALKKISDLQTTVNTIQSDLLAQNGLIQSLDARVTALENQ